MIRTFKAGDRVKVYPIAKNGEVITFDVSGNIAVGFDDNAGSMQFFHPKQCRKLIKKERRRVWIRNPEFLYYIRHSFQIPTELFSNVPADGFVEFVEVRNKK